MAVVKLESDRAMSDCARETRACWLGWKAYLQLVVILGFLYH